MVNEIYDRQSQIPDWDQTRLENAEVAIIGAGAIGNHVSMGLIGLGIGTIRIFDSDIIKAHNLNRQSLFLESDIGNNKAETLAERLSERNSSLFIQGYNEKITQENIEDLLGSSSLVVDCVDLISVRWLLNRYCLEHDIPLIHGGISWNGGQVAILTRNTPCVHCIYPLSLRAEEEDRITSCIDRVEPSVIYTAQIIAGLMVERVRNVLMPLKEDIPHEVFGELNLWKFDFRFSPPFYHEKIYRKKNCDCLLLLSKFSPEIFNKESILAKKRKLKDREDIERIFKRDG